MQSSETDFKQYLQLLIRRKVLFIVLAMSIMTGAIVTSFVLPKKYVAQSTVFIEKNVISELVKGITFTPSMDDAVRVLTYTITSRKLLEKVVDNLDMNLTKNGTADMDALIGKLQQNITVSVQGKDLFIIAYRDSNPRLARDVVNTLVRLYIEENSSLKRGESYDATNFLSEQIDVFNKKLEKAEDDVNAYKREKGGLIAINEGKQYEEINIAKQKLYDLELRRHQLEGMRQATKKASDPLQGKLIVLQKKLDDLRTTYTDSYPEVIMVKGEIEEVKEQMKTAKTADHQPLDPQEIDKIDAEISAIKLSEEGQRRFIASNEELLRRIPSAKADLEKLISEKNNQKYLYDQLFTRRGQAEVSKQMEVQDKGTTFRIVDAAILPKKPVSPNRLKIMMMGIIGGIAGSFGVLLLLDMIDNSVKGVEAAKGLGMPVLAVIPHIAAPLELEMQHKRSVLLYTFAGLYFLFVLCFPLMELLGMSYVDKVVDNISHINIVQNVKNHLR